METILVCLCSQSGIIPEATRRALAGLAGAGPVQLVPDLCALAARRDPRLKVWAGAPLTIVACYPRAVRALFAAAGAPLPEGVRWLNARTDAPGALIESIRALLAPGTSAAPEAAAPEPVPAESDGWIAWFPAIDRERCHNCQQCLSFCLFGVYGLDEQGQVSVQNPRACKTHCPACARICPEVALIFPQHPEAPINGALITDENLERGKVQANLDRALGPDVYGALQARRQRAQVQRLVKRT